MRSKGQPVRLFGESDKDRRLRLRALELIEEKGGDKSSGLNDFKKALEDVERFGRGMDGLVSSGRDKDGKSKGKGKDDGDGETEGVLDLGLVKTDPDKLYPLIYYALKRRLKEWEESMGERPGRFDCSSRVDNV